VEEDSPVIIQGGREVWATMDVNFIVTFAKYQTPDEGVNANEMIGRLREDDEFLKARLSRQRILDVKNRKASRLLEQTDALLELIVN